MLQQNNPLLEQISNMVQVPLHQQSNHFSGLNYVPSRRNRCSRIRSLTKPLYICSNWKSSYTAPLLCSSAAPFLLKMFQQVHLLQQRPQKTSEGFVATASKPVTSPSKKGKNINLFSFYNFISFSV